MRRVKRFKVSTTTTTTQDVSVEYEDEFPTSTACLCTAQATSRQSDSAQTVCSNTMSDVEETPLQIGLKHAQGYYQHLVKESSQTKYNLAYVKWQNFCDKSGIPSLPADPVHVSACLSLQMFETESLSSVVMLRSAIANKHRMSGLPSPTDDPRISNLFQAFNRLYGSPRSPVDPITYPMVKLMINHLKKQGFEGRQASLVTWRTVWSIAINFFTLGRFADL